ncbi:NAD(P)-binding protein [Ganoderma leucocontextum]|nr:NAD(P)-binding protein [Ganoderma leucocontextum]
MPAIDSGKVLVTGASGYIAGWVLKALLDRGFSVRGTVRSESKSAVLKEVFKTYGARLECVIVEDIAKEGAFDAAVVDVDAIAHTASPFHLDADDPDEIIVPAVQGTVNLLASARRHGKNVKRVVLTSSCTAIAAPGMEGATVDERDWNEGSIQEVRTKGRAAHPIDKYRASKTLSERAAWDWYEGKKEELGWDMVVLNPSFVLGPWLHKAESIAELSPSLRHYHSIVMKGQMGSESLAETGTSWVDVRDVAEAHALAFIEPAVGGERIIVSANAFKWQDLILVARKIEGDKIPAGNTSYDPSKAKHVQVVADKGRQMLGLKYHTLEETTRHTLHEFKCRGWF